MSGWLEPLAATLASESAVIVSVAAVRGSVPREAGATMIVSRHRTIGSIGGGHLEYEATRLARDALAEGETPARWLVRFPLAARLGQCCGGVATLAFARLARGVPSWIAAAQELELASVPLAVVAMAGSGDAAAPMLVVGREVAYGSLGDATLDARVLAEARARLAVAADGRLDAGGVVEVAEGTVLIHLVAPRAPAIVLFGNGHVGRALAHILGVLPVHVRWVDAREADFPASVPDNIEIVAHDDPVGEVARAPVGACVVVMTHSHALDFDLVGAALARDDLAYVGLIGSRSKRRQFEARLAARGFDASRIARLVCPIGAGALVGREPGVIALAVAAELMALRQRDAALPVATSPTARTVSERA